MKRTSGLLLILIFLPLSLAADSPWAPVLEGYEERWSNPESLAHAAPTKSEVSLPPPPDAMLIDAEFWGDKGEPDASMLLITVTPRSPEEVIAFYEQHAPELTPAEVADGEWILWVEQPGWDPFDSEPPTIHITDVEGEEAGGKPIRAEVAVMVFR